MVRESRRTPLVGSAFIRLLAALDDVDVPPPKDAFGQRLSQWFDWTAAIPLSAALRDAPAGLPVGAVDAGVGASGAALAIAREVARVRSGLVKAIAQTSQASGMTARPGAGRLVAQSAPAAPSEDFAPHRQHYRQLQQAMDANIGPLRRRVRSVLSGGSPAQARLADVDAVMEQVVGAHERALLASVPARLERHFERLCRAQAAAPPAGLVRFRQDAQDLLLAELDLRLQPVEGLLEALRKPSSPDRHE